MDPYVILVWSSALIGVSYLFDLMAKVIRVPAVLMILALGMALNRIALHFSLNIPDTEKVLQVLGTLGLILIVLEGALDLHLSRDRLPLIRRAFGSAFFILILTCGLIALLFHFWLRVPWMTGLVNALPLGVISSAIAVPSVVNLHKDKKEFIVYESTFSDILGIMLFNYIAFTPSLTGLSVLNLGIEAVLIVLISFVGCLLLLFFLDKVTHHIKFILVLAILILAYSVGKMYHLSTLILIFVFGLIMNNTDLVLRGHLNKWFTPAKLKTELEMLKNVTSELAFLIRTFFFLVFGFSISLSGLFDIDILLAGSAIVAGIWAVRYLYLRLWIGPRIMPELFIAPRGLITILLYYSIPDTHRIVAFDHGTLFFVIAVSTLAMSVALITSKNKNLPGQVIVES